MKGIVLYEINSDGCLNGVYSNDMLEGEIFNEIARKRPADMYAEGPQDDLTGIYDCRYFDVENQLLGDTLRISIDQRKRRFTEYTFEWFNGRTASFNGFGFRMNNRQVAVRYTNGSDSQDA